MRILGRGRELADSDSKLSLSCWNMIFGEERGCNLKKQLEHVGTKMQNDGKPTHTVNSRGNRTWCASGTDQNDSCNLRRKKYFTSSDPHRDIILLHICHKV